MFAVRNTLAVMALAGLVAVQAATASTLNPSTPSSESARVGDASSCATNQAGQFWLPGTYKLDTIIKHIPRGQQSYDINLPDDVCSTGFLIFGNHAGTKVRACDNEGDAPNVELYNKATGTVSRNGDLYSSVKIYIDVYCRPV